MKKTKILILGLIVLAFIVTISLPSYGKYVIECKKVAINLEIDRTKPIGTVKYSTTKLTNGEVTVTIISNEPILEIDGWKLSKDKLSLTKVYNENFVGKIQIIDLSGNENTVDINIQNIDKDLPVIELVGVENVAFANTENATSDNEKCSTNKLIAKIKISDMQIDNNTDIDIDKINILINQDKSTCTKVLSNLNKTDTEITFDLELEQLESNENLKIFIPDGFVKDTAGNNSKEIILPIDIAKNNVPYEFIVNSNNNMK